MEKEPHQITPNTTREESEEEKDGGKHNEDEAIEGTQYEIDGIKSRLLREENGRKNYYYEVQWRGCPDSENTYELGKDIVDTPTTRKWKKLADKGRACGPTVKQEPRPNQQCICCSQQNGPYGSAPSSQT